MRSVTTPLPGPTFNHHDSPCQSGCQPVADCRRAPCLRSGWHGHLLVRLRWEIADFHQLCRASAAPLALAAAADEEAAATLALLKKGSR